MIITLHHVACDEGGCSNTGPQAHTQTYARADAQTLGWDIGPREIRKGVMQHTDYCPAHKRTEGSGDDG